MIRFFLPVLIFTTFNQCSRNTARQSSWALLPFVKVDSVNPVLSAGTGKFFCPVRKDTVSWEEKDVFNPAAVIHNSKIYLLYRAEDRIGRHAGTSRLGLAESDDGLHFTRLPQPVLYPDNDSLLRYEWEGGVEDPRIVKSPDGRYILTYTAYDGKIARLMLATSTDLRSWHKYGPVLQGKFRDTWSKSGVVVAEEQGGQLIARLINGKYWMYFGDTDIFMAHSNDLLHWEPLTENGELKPVLKPRKGYFDSRLVEPGPVALLGAGGILLLYNGMNLDKGGDERLAPGTYAGGQALFSRDDPTLLIDRLENYFIVPDKPYELTGQVNRVCFIEGLVFFKEKWYLYYGTADSHIAVAVKH
ncbi:MAG: glycoside hydrolase family 130 protein [Cyclobacteriaceae bacterium]|nr:glycoside hydrolase family 130 protein [Cyclobacteriaceae bacterium]MDW8330737.1 glycoside hydrolase family 130 protein [Cyclobacteriaceae bacterium]